MSSSGDGRLPSTESDVSREGLEQVPCAEFEQTTRLLDGLLEGTTLHSALGHCATCSVCGPLVAGWGKASAILVHQLEDAAERAKPELADVADRVLARIETEGIEQVEVPEHPALRRFLFRLNPWLALGAAAAAIALTVGPLLRPGALEGASEGQSDAVAMEVAALERLAESSHIETATPSSGIAKASEGLSERAAADRAPADESATDCIVRKLSFDGADGMVYRAGADGGMTVIWINEHEGA